MKNWGLFIFFTLLTLGLSAQHNQKLDSLLAAYDRQADSPQKIKTASYLFNAVVYTNPAAGKMYAQKELTLARKYQKPRGIGMGHYHLGAYYRILQNYDSAKYHTLRALHYFTRAENLSDQGMAYSALGMSEFDRGNYRLALKYADSVYRIYDKLNDHYRRAVMQGFKGDIYYQLGQYQLALNEQLKGLRVLDTLDKPVRRAEFYSALAPIEFELDNLSAAIEYSRQAYQIYRQHDYETIATEQAIYTGSLYLWANQADKAHQLLVQAVKDARRLNISRALGDAHIALGRVYRLQGEYPRSLDTLRAGLKIQEELGAAYSITQAKHELALTYNKLNEPQTALKLLNQALHAYDTLQTTSDLSLAYRDRSQIYQDLNRPYQALEDFKKHFSLEDSLLNLKKSTQLEELKTIYELEKKEQTLARQRAKVALLEKRAQVNRLQRVLLLGGILFTLAVLVVSYYAFRQKIIRNKLEQEKLDTELTYKRKELTSHALNLAQKNELLESLKLKLKELSKLDSSPKTYQQLVNSIRMSQQDDKNWENFRKYFEEVHTDFTTLLRERCPAITPNEMRLLALMKLNLSTKEIANVLNISAEGVKKARYRLRKKLDLPSEENMQKMILTL